MDIKPALRRAAPSDLAAINDIYNFYVLNSECTYQEEPETMAAREQWFLHHGARHPVLVAEIGTQVVGWGSLSAFHPRSAYRFTAEDSVYVHHDHRGKGIGSLLLGQLIHHARELEYRAIIAGIDAGQTGSVALHSRFGFQEVGHLKQVGYKFRRWLDVYYMELVLPQSPAPERI